jgi:hypothetical protein
MNEFQQRLQHARELDQLLHPSNCIGTALYLIGEIEEDNPIDPWLAYPSFLCRLQELKYPCKECIVAWHEFESVAHCAVVTDLKPLLVAQRRTFAGHLDVDIPLECVHAEYIGSRASHYRYYFPRKNSRR